MAEPKVAIYALTVALLAPHGLAAQVASKLEAGALVTHKDGELPSNVLQLAPGVQYDGNYLKLSAQGAAWFSEQQWQVADGTVSGTLTSPTVYGVRAELLGNASRASVLVSLSRNWPFLLVSALVAGFLKVYMDQQRIAAFLKRNQKQGVVGATAVAVATPLCSCGTTAVILGMMANLMPWAPVVAFMVASPLTSPQEMIYSAGLFGWPFAIAFFAASILLGLLGGWIAYVFESRGLLADQARFKPAPVSGEILVGPAPTAATAEAAKPRWQLALRESGTAGLKLLAFFLSFAFIGFLLNGLIPPNLVSLLFGGGHIYGVPLAATLGLPLYVNTEASLPLVRSLLDLGMSPGATLAFLITGAGTSIGAIAGALTIARWRVVGIVIGTLWAGGILLGYAYNILLHAGVLVW